MISWMAFCLLRRSGLCIFYPLSIYPFSFSLAFFFHFLDFIKTNCRQIDSMSQQFNQIQISDTLSFVHVRVCALIGWLDAGRQQQPICCESCIDCSITMPHSVIRLQYTFNIKASKTETKWKAIFTHAKQSKLIKCWLKI